MEPVLNPTTFVDALPDTTIGDGMHFIDGDTVRTRTGESIRLQNFNTPEVAHTDDYTGVSDYHNAGSEYHRQIARLARENGFTEVQRSGETDVYGRTLGDLYNPETGEKLSSFLAQQGVVAPATWADKQTVDASIMGVGQALEGREREDSVQQAIDAVYLANGGSPEFKTLALNEAEYDEDLHAGVSLRRLDRSLDNEALRPLSTSFDTALIGMGAAVQGMKQMVGHVTGNVEMEEAGRIGVAERQELLKDKPKVIIDYKDVNSISDGVQYLANNAVMSAPYMANTMASAAAGALTGAVVGSAVPVVGTAVGAVAGGIVGLSSPTAVYAGQVYNGQDEKNWKVALTSGVAQASLDRLGLKGIQVSGRSLKSVLKEAEDTLVRQGIPRTEAKRRIGGATKTELMGLVNDADNIIKQQLRARNVTRTILNRAAKGAGSEAVTEAAQETLGHIGENWTEENLGLFDHDRFNSEFIDRITNAAIAGGTLGGAFGSAGGIREVGGWADAAWDRGKPRTSFEDTLAQLEDSNVTLAEEMAAMDRDEKNTLDIAFRVNADQEHRAKLTASEKAVESIKNAPILWRGMMRARMSKDSLVRSSSYRKLGAIFGATLGRIKPGDNYEDSMTMTSQRYYNIMGPDERLWYQGMGKNDKDSKAKFNGIIGRFDADINEWIENNSDGKGNLNKGVSIERDYDWSKWNQYTSPGFKEVLNEDPSKNMVRQFYEQREQTSAKMRERQNWWWNKNAKTIVDPQTGAVTKETLPPKIRKLNNHLGKFKAMKRKVIADRRGDFEALLRSEYGFSKDVANELTTKILDGEPLDGHDETIFDLISKGVPQTSAKKRTMGLSQNPKFTEFFHQDYFHNIREATRAAARFETFHKFVGRDNWRVAKMLDEAAQQGVPQEEVNMMARAIQNYLEAQSGNYKRPAKGSYGERALGVQRFLLSWSLFTSLTLSAFSSMVELMLVTSGLTKSQIFNNINNLASEAAGGFGRFISRYSRDAFTGEEFISGSPFMTRLAHLGYLNFEAGAATTVGATEYADWSKGLVERFFKYNGLQDLTNTTRALRLATYTDFLTNHIDTLEKADPNSEQYRFAREQIRNLGVPVDRYVALITTYGPHTKENAEQLEQMHMLAEYTYINQTVALPGAANRPLFYQDPRLALFTQFNGYIATFTANHLPKLWSEYVGRGRPSMKYSTFAMMTMMIFMGFVSQYLKDWLKYGEPSPYLNSQEKLRRAVNSSGLMGQGERALNFIWPTFENNKPNQSMVGYAADTVFDEMPAMGPLRRMMKAADAAYEGDQEMATYNTMRAMPIIGPFTGLAEKASGLDFSEYQKK